MSDAAHTEPPTSSVPEWTLGDRLAKALKHGGVSVQAMADYLGVARTTIGNYTAERTKVPRGTLVAWALRTGVSIEWLETGTVAPSGPNGTPTLGSSPGACNVNSGAQVIPFNRAA